MPKVLISQPINYEMLAESFVRAKRRWPTGFPDANMLEQEISLRIADLSTRPGPREVYNSGGIDVEWQGEAIVVLIDSKLAVHYQRPPSAPDHQPAVFLAEQPQSESSDPR